MQALTDLLMTELQGKWACVRQDGGFSFHGSNGREVELTKENNRILARVKWPWQDGYLFTPWFCGVEGWREDSQIQTTCGINQPPEKMAKSILNKVFGRLEEVYPIIEVRYREHQRRRQELETRVKHLESILGGKAEIDGLEATINFKYGSGSTGFIIVENHVSLTHQIEARRISTADMDLIADIISKDQGKKG